MVEQKDINCVFDSQICTQRLSKETLGSMFRCEEDFPDVHNNGATYSASYGESSMIELLNDRNAYQKLF